MVGRARIDLFRNYIGAVERHEIVCPRIDALYTEHKYCGEDDLYGPRASSGHGGRPGNGVSRLQDRPSAR